MNFRKMARHRNNPYDALYEGVRVLGGDALDALHELSEAYSLEAERQARS